MWGGWGGSYRDIYSGVDVDTSKIPHVALNTESDDAEPDTCPAEENFNGDSPKTRMRPADVAFETSGTGCRLDIGAVRNLGVTPTLERARYLRAPKLGVLGRLARRSISRK